MTTTNGTLSIMPTAGIVQALHNFIDKKLVNLNAEIVNVNVDTSNESKIDGILLIALDHDTAVAYDDIYASLEGKLKQRADLLKVASKSDDPIFDSEGCEVPKVSKKFNKSSIVITF